MVKKESIVFSTSMASKANAIFSKLLIWIPSLLVQLPTIHKRMWDWNSWFNEYEGGFEDLIHALFSLFEAFLKESQGSL